MRKQAFLSRFLAAFVAALSIMLAAPVHADEGDITAASRSVVRIIVLGSDGRSIFLGKGSGFAVTPTKIITNAHVIEPAYQYPDSVAVGVVPADGDEIQRARLIGYSPQTDLALLEMVGNTELPVGTIFTAPMPDGAAVHALGYPASVDDAQGLGFGDVIKPMKPVRTSGTLSGGRSSMRMETILHTAAIAGGNSGGPLVDNCGRIVGVNTFGTMSTGSDAEFFFAIAPTELRRFLRKADITPSVTDVRCRSREEIEREEAARQAELDAEQARLAEEERLAMEERRDKVEQTILEERENGVALAALCLAIGLIAAGGAAMLLNREKRQPAIGTGLLAAALVVGAVVIFLSRPSLSEVDERLEAENSSSNEAGIAKAVAGDRQYSCVVDRERSRITVSRPENFELDWQEDGCVSGQTQYARNGDIWRRVFVPNEDQTVTLSSFDPEAGEFVTGRYLLSKVEMRKLRDLRQRHSNKSCSTNPDMMRDISQMIESIRDELPEMPNENVIYRCSVNE